KFDKLNEKIANGNRLSTFEKADYKELKETINDYLMFESQVESAKNTYQQSIMDMIDANVVLDENTSKTTKGIINDFTLFVATSKLSTEEMNNVFDNTLDALESKDFKSAFQTYGEAIKEYEDAISNNKSSKEIKKFEKDIKTSFDNVKKVLTSTLPKGTDPKIIDDITSSLTRSGEAAVISSLDYEKLSEATGKTKEELMAQLALVPDASVEMDSYADATNNASNAQSNLSVNIEKVNSVFAQSAQAYEDTSNSVRPLNELLEKLAEGKQISAAEAMDLIAKEHELAKAITIENGVVTVNTELIKERRDAHVGAYKDKMQTLKAELEAEKKLIVEKLKIFGIELK